MSITRVLLPKDRRIGIFSAALLICGMVSAGRALAHHSYAAYDETHIQTVEGTLEDFDWGAPHTSMTVMYLDKAGHVQRVSATTGAPVTIIRQGFKISDFKAGMKVELRWYPNKNGAPGGEMALLKLPDGKVLRGHGYEQFVLKQPPGTQPAKTK